MLRAALMMRWFKQWLEAWKLAKIAKTILDDPEANSMASVNAKVILAALAERRPVCRHCFQPFEVKERTFPERFQIRAVLMIPDSEPDPMLCDSCFTIAVTTYNPRAANIGTSNSGPANMVLQKLG
jgi:hypothetical protein